MNVNLNFLSNQSFFLKKSSKTRVMVQHVKSDYDSRVLPGLGENSKSHLTCCFSRAILTLYYLVLMNWIMSKVTCVQNQSHRQIQQELP